MEGSAIASKPATLGEYLDKVVRPTIERHKAALAPATADEDTATLAAIAAAAQARARSTGASPDLDLSKTEIPARNGGPPGSPVRLISPDMACTMRS